MLRTNRTCNSIVGFSKYEFYNKLLYGIILLKSWSNITWTQPSRRNQIKSAWQWPHKEEEKKGGGVVWRRKKEKERKKKDEKKQSGIKDLIVISQKNDLINLIFLQLCPYNSYSI